MLRSLSVLSAGVVAIAIAGATKADEDLVRLDGKGDADVLEARVYGGGFRGGVGYGGYRGGFGYGGYRGGFGYGGYRGFGYGGYRGYGYGGYYRPAYYRGGFGLGLGLGLGYGGYYGGGYGGYYGGSYYSTPAYYSQPYYSSYYYSPCASASAVVAPQTLTITQPPAPSDGTYPYDGGPAGSYFAPMPAPTGTQYRGESPRDGRLVSIPAESSGYRFLAFGEQPTEPSPAANDTLRVSLPGHSESAHTLNLTAASMAYPSLAR